MNRFAIRDLLPAMLVAGLLMLGGCAGQARVYSVTLHNASTTPLTIWLTKDGGPVEENWKSPDQLAVERPAADERIAGVVVEPGKTAETTPVEGTFEPGVNAWLRIYIGTWTFDELLAISKGSVNRKDVLLYPGLNTIRVREDGGQIVVEHLDAPSRP